MSPLHELIVLNGRSLRYALGLVLLVAGGAILALKVWDELQGRLTPPLWHAWQGGMLCALATVLGALPVLFMRSISLRLHTALLGFGGGMMLAASCFSLLLPALQVTREHGLQDGQGFALVALGALAGGLGLWALGRYLACSRWPLSQAIAEDNGLRTWLMVIAIVLHNVPEGMAVGVSAAAQRADGLALGLALQDVPEGLVVALVLASAGMARWKAVSWGVASGLVEPLFALLCAWLVGISTQLLPWGLALAGGAMLFVVLREIVPALYRRNDLPAALGGLAFGLGLMMALDIAFSA